MFNTLDKPLLITVPLLFLLSGMMYFVFSTMISHFGDVIESKHGLHEHGPEVKYPVFVEYENHYVFRRYWFEGDVTKSEPTTNQTVMVKKGTIVSYEFDLRDNGTPGPKFEEHELDSQSGSALDRNTRYYVHFTLKNGKEVTIGYAISPEFGRSNETDELFGMAGEGFHNQLEEILSNKRG